MHKEKFLISHQDVYLAGHSLGPCLQQSVELVNEALQAYQKRGVTAWNECQWFDLKKNLAHQMALLIGAQQHEVMIGDCTTVNLLCVTIKPEENNHHDHR